MALRYCLLKIDAKVNLRTVSSDIVASLPNRNSNEISEEFRSQLFTYTSSDVAVNLFRSSSICYVYRSKRR